MSEKIYRVTKANNGYILHILNTYFIAKDIKELLDLIKENIEEEDPDYIPF